VLRKFWGIVPSTAQDAKTIYEADKDSVLYLKPSQTEMRWCCTKDTWAWEETALV
jgi:hypothetical protein